MVFANGSIFKYSTCKTIAQCVQNNQNKSSLEIQLAPGNYSQQVSDHITITIHHHQLSHQHIPSPSQLAIAINHDRHTTTPPYHRHRHHNPLTPSTPSHITIGTTTTTLRDIVALTWGCLF